MKEKCIVVVLPKQKFENYLGLNFVTPGPNNGTPHFSYFTQANEFISIGKEERLDVLFWENSTKSNYHVNLLKSSVHPMHMYIVSLTQQRSKEDYNPDLTSLLESGKLIASTDHSLNLPSIHSNFLKLYADQQENKVLVEMEYENWQEEMFDNERYLHGSTASVNLISSKRHLQT